MANRRILIVSARPGVAGDLAARLRTIGYDVVGIASSASSGGDAVAVADSAAPEVALVDTADDGGITPPQAAAAIRARRPIPIVFIGPAAEEESGGRESSPEALVLVPPFGDRELRTTLELAICEHGASRAADELEAFFSVSIDMFCFLDVNGYFRRLNPAWERTLGFTGEELMSRPFIEFVHPDDRERTLKQNAEVRAGGQATGFENRYLCKDGSYRWLMWNATRQPARGVIYSAARDITARKLAEEERARLLRKVESALAEVRTLRDILPICMYCRKIRDDGDYWQTVESYISKHTSTRFSHGICPSCLTTEVEPQLSELDED